MMMHDVRYMRRMCRVSLALKYFLHQNQDNNNSQKLLKKSKGIELIPVTIGMRKSFSHATVEGLAVSEYIKAS